jgi:uncharacterized membrane protein YphA (DoxX/SURF4 family)
LNGFVDWIAILRRRRWLNLVVANLRIMIGFGFLPAGLKKVLGQPFTDPGNVGPFHDFLHAFLDTGPLYRFVGVLQITGALLLMTQRFAAVGAAILAPVLCVIAVFVWTTAGIPTRVTATLMLAGVVGLLLWDIHKWRGLLFSDRASGPLELAPAGEVIDDGLWWKAGLAVASVYFGSCLLYGGVYRPRGAEWNEPGFYVMPAIALIPLVTLLIDRMRYRRGDR